MAWQLSIQTKSSGEHLIEFATEDEAKAAHGRATGELARAMNGDKVATLKEHADLHRH